MENSIYKDMYCRLFNRVTDVIGLTKEENIRDLLIKAQQETEEMFMSADEEEDNVVPLILK